MRVTAREFADKYGVEQIHAGAILNFLVSRGQATLCDEKRKSSAGKGRSSNVYELPDTITLTF